VQLELLLLFLNTFAHWLASSVLFPNNNNLKPEISFSTLAKEGK